MSMGICRGLAAAVFVLCTVVTEGEEGLGQYEKTLAETDFESLSVADGGVGGQVGDGGSRWEVRKRELLDQGIEACFPLLLRRNLAIMVNFCFD